MKKIINIISFCILISPVFSGTTGKLVGIVKDKETGEPLIGCNVILEGTYIGINTPYELK